MIEFLLLDLDDTILDFHQSEYVAIRRTLPVYGVTPTDEVCDLYSRINLAHWKALERKEITREELMVSRFVQLFEQLGVQADAKSCAVTYMDYLGQGHYFIPGAFEAVKQLSQKYKLYLVSNGTTEVQVKRIASAKIEPLFRGIYISQQVGVDKPDKLFFDRVFADIPSFDRTKAMIIGDSTSSDMQGGKNAGIATCWINPKHRKAPEHLTPDYQLESITQLEDLLAKL